MNPLPIRAKVAQILLQHFPNSKFSTIGDATDQICMLSQLHPGVKTFPENFTEFLLTLTINHPVRGIVPFEPMSEQMELANLLAGSESRIVHRGLRQSGKTLMMNAFALWTALSKPYQFVLYVTINQSTLSNSRHILDRMIVPEYSDHVESHNLRHVKFINGSQIYFVNAKSVHEAKGRACSMIIVDDADTIPKKHENELLDWIYPMISSTGKIIISGSQTNFSGMFNSTLNDLHWHKIDQI